jgi:outer membrane protein OmpA-like peptidoglycan-associated protein
LAQQATADGCSVETAALAPVYFGTKSARVTPKALAQLKQLAKCNPGKQIELIGHTDERGDDASNLRLS